MPCFHKFFSHHEHLAGENGLLPNWDVDILIIGTFNPCNEWVPGNEADYFYGRPNNYFWDVLPKFACAENIDKQDVNSQLSFLQKKRIALTDLLITINDADIENNDHVNFLADFQDNGFNNFNDFFWNTTNITNFIRDKNISTVYFTKRSGGAPFGREMRIIEKFCNLNSIPNYRLHTPSGQRLGPGIPRENRLIHKWFEQGGNQFPFLCHDFNINDPQFGWA